MILADVIAAAAVAVLTRIKCRYQEGILLVSNKDSDVILKSNIVSSAPKDLRHSFDVIQHPSVSPANMQLLYLDTTQGVPL